MTYRLDSDFSNPYGWVEPAGQPLGIPPKPNDFPDLTFDAMSETNYHSEFLETLKQKTAKKEKLVAWMVSNCKTHSQREDFVKELQNHIPVDIYGECGKLKCKHLENDQNHCLQNIEDNYKFYLSFENSICNEYVTEKFWQPLG